jgi:hypothetical protein
MAVFWQGLRQSILQKSKLFEALFDARLAGSVWQSFAAAEWVDFDDIEERFQQVRLLGCLSVVGTHAVFGWVP